MTVEFNVDDDQRFKDSLEALDESEADAVLDTLEMLGNAGLSWNVFAAQAQWAPLPIHGQDTYPGANEMHSFFINLPNGPLMEIAGYTYDQTVVVCAVARHP